MNYRVSAQDGEWHVVDEHGCWIGTFESQSQAQVAAAGHEMLAALRQFVEMDQGRLLYGPMLHNEICEAIAKAEGRYK